MLSPTQIYAQECAAKGLRGDYSACRSDFTVEQDYAAYSAEHHEVWTILAARQSLLAQKFAHQSYVSGLKTLDLVDRIPRFETVSQTLFELSGWQLVPVPGLIPAEPFFAHLAQKRFPVTNWLRSMDELDYVVEPDLFHDFFGHVPILVQPEFGDFMQLYGQRALEAIALGGTKLITRLYWYTAEYGLIQEEGQELKAFGAGLLSSGSELPFSLGPSANRVPASIQTIMRTGYEIDRFQRAYFVQRSFGELFEQLTQLDLAAMVAQWGDSEPLDPGSL